MLGTERRQEEGPVCARASKWVEGVRGGESATRIVGAGWEGRNRDAAVGTSGDDGAESSPDIYAKCSGLQGASLKRGLGLSTAETPSGILRTTLDVCADLTKV